MDLFFSGLKIDGLLQNWALTYVMDYRTSIKWAFLGMSLVHKSIYGPILHRGIKISLHLWITRFTIYKVLIL